jgi:hypothetical protein
MFLGCFATAQWQGCAHHRLHLDDLLAMFPFVFLNEARKE